MKTKIYNSICYILIALFLLPVQSCTILGMAIDRKSNKLNAKIHKDIIVDGSGWIQPEHSNSQLELSLKTGKTITGRFYGIENIEINNISYELALIDVDESLKKIPTHYITNTKILKSHKSTSRGLITGLSIDLLVLSILINNIYNK